MIPFYPWQTPMIYHISAYFTPTISGLNVLRYVSVRAIIALLSTLSMFLLWGQWFIEHSKVVFRSKARPFTPESHRLKDDMPTMGGIFILAMVMLNAVLWCNLFNPLIWIFLLCLLCFGAIGFADDWLKIKRNKGVSARAKFIAQWGSAALVVGLWYACGASTHVSFPFFKSFNPDLGLLFIPWAMFIIVACSNAVNLTDGLDGLAIGSLMPNFGVFALVCYVAGHAKLAAYLQIPFAGSAELAVLGAILVGAALGFLWFNTYPAQIFMGDVGSLALGSGLALMALMAKQELLLVIAGGLFVVETLSVIVQIFSFKVFGRRMFKMAPIHHHFELLGWPESKITVRFFIISFVLCLLALVTLKLR